MSRFKVYSPDQAYLLPPSVRDELGERHRCFFVREVIERLDMSLFEQSYSAEGGELCAPQLMLGVWLYAYALGITSARQVERRLVEDLAFRYLAGGERVDNWALSAFRRRHARALNDAARRRARCWPTADFSRSKISNGWNNKRSMPTYPTRTLPAN
jgi:transposase